MSRGLLPTWVTEDQLRWVYKTFKITVVWFRLIKVQFSNNNCLWIFGMNRVKIWKFMLLQPNLMWTNHIELGISVFNTHTCHIGWYTRALRKLKIQESNQNLYRLYNTVFICGKCNVHALVRLCFFYSKFIVYPAEIWAAIRVMFLIQH